MACKIGSAVIAICLLCFGVLVFKNRDLLQAPVSSETPSESTEWIHVESDFSPSLFASFEDSSAGDPRSARPVSEDATYRLAGTFISYDSEVSSEVKRKAIIDNVSEQKQSLVSPGDVIDSVWTVKTVEPERVEFVSDSGKILTLYLGLTPSATANTAEADKAPAPNRLEDMAALSTSDFGKQIADDRWVLSRSSIIEYYNELLNEPERLASIFLSMEDVTEDNQLVGYRVGPKGEQPFFDAFGLQSNDVVKAVNSMKMVNPRRSQYLFQEFMQDRVNTFVFDVERDGEEKKLIYLIR